MRGEELVIEHRGERLTLRQWSERTGIPKRAIYCRIVIRRRPVEWSLTAPLRATRRGGGRPAAGIPRQCPALKEHASGRAYARWKAHGRTHERYFGLWGSEEAAAGYRRFAGEWATGAFERAKPVADGLAVGELAMAWITHVRREYVKDGKPTSYVSQARCVVRYLQDVGRIPAAEFTPAHLRAVRDGWIKGEFARDTINSYTSRLLEMLRWGVGQSLIPPAVYQAAHAVERLRPGRTQAREPAPRKPVSDAHIAATMPQLAVQNADQRAKLAAMIQIQRLTGMRPGEVCKLRLCDLDRAGDVWRYVVDKNKNMHRGKAQAYYFGPRAVAILAPFLIGVGDSERVFAPISRSIYTHAIQHAARRAGIPHWCPHQLRHALATEVAERFRSLEHAAAAIGDSNAVAQAVYVHMDPRERAKIEVAREMG